MGPYFYLVWGPEHRNPRIVGPFKEEYLALDWMEENRTYTDKLEAPVMFQSASNQPEVAWDVYLAEQAEGTL